MMLWKMTIYSSLIMYKIKVTSISFSKNHYLVSELKNFFPETIINSKYLRYEGDDLIKFLSDADGAIIGVESINDYVLKGLPNLKSAFVRELVSNLQGLVLITEPSVNGRPSIPPNLAGK